MTAVPRAKDVTKMDLTLRSQVSTFVGRQERIHLREIECGGTAPCPLDAKKTAQRVTLTGPIYDLGYLPT